MQKDLQHKYNGQWPALEPENGHLKLLWMIVEANEVADVIKKQGEDKIINDVDARAQFIDEVCDTLMCLNQLTLCYDVTPEELHQAYVNKYQEQLDC